MPAGADSRRRLVVEADYDGSGITQGVRPSQAAIKSLAEDVTRASNEFRLGATSADKYAQELLQIRNSAIDMAQGLNRSSLEYRQLTTAALQAESALEKVQGSTSRTSRAVDLLRDGLGALGLAFGVQELIQFGIASGQMAEQAGRAEQAVIALSGSAATASTIIRGIEDAGDGAISRLDASGFAARALALGLADTANEAALFTRTVTVLGASVGKDATESFNQLQLAIANLSFERLDSLGISASNVRIRFNELKDAGIEATEAFRIAVLEEAAGRLAELDAAGFKASTSSEKLGASWANLTLAFGNTGVYQGVAEGLNTVVTGISGVIESSNQLTLAQTLLGQALRDTGTDLLRLNDASSQFELANAFLETAVAAGISRGEAAALYQQLTDLNTVHVILAGNTYINRDAVIDYTNSVIEANALSNTFGGALEFVQAATVAAANAMPVLQAQADYLADKFIGVTVSANAAAIAIGNAFGASADRFGAVRNKIGRSEDNPFFRLGDGGGSGLGGGVEFIIEGYQEASLAAVAAAEKAARGGG